MATRAKRLLGPIWPGIAFFAVILLMSIPNGTDTLTTIANVHVTAHSHSLAKALGSSDAGSLLSAAMSYRDHGLLLQSQFWIYNFWPPGMVVVDLGLLRLEAATGIGIVLLMVLLNALIWSAAFGFIFVVIRNRRGIAAATVFAIAGLLYTGTSIWGVRSGLFYSDSFGVLAYCVGLVLLYLVAEYPSGRRRVVHAALAGVFFATAAYFRASFDLVGNALLILGAVAIVFLVIYRRFGRSARWQNTLSVAMLPIAVSGFSYTLFTLPWRIYAGTHIRLGDFRWTTVADLFSGARWQPDSRLTGSAAFERVGHLNWACDLDPSQCARIARLEAGSNLSYTGLGHFTNAQFDQFTVHSVLTHPVQFVAERLGIMSVGFGTATGASLGTMAIAESIVLIATLCVLVFAFFRHGGLRNPGYVAFAIATAIQIGTLALLHMESRYFMGIELSIIVMGVLVIGAPWGRFESRRTDDLKNSQLGQP